MPYGRGGAGNIYQQQSQQSQTRSAAHRTPSELEASESAYTSDDVAAAVASNVPTAEHKLTQQQQQQYAHMGRGGAGNYYSPVTLQQSGMFEETQTPTSASTPVKGSAIEQAQAERPTRMSGRGGAGNFSFGVAEEEEVKARRRVEEERAREERVKEDVQRRVEGELAMPARARVVRGRANDEVGEGWV